MHILTAAVFPVSMLCFAWTTMTWIPPIVPVLASAVWGWCFYTMILMTVVYIGDSYGVSVWSFSLLSLHTNILRSTLPLPSLALPSSATWQAPHSPSLATT